MSHGKRVVDAIGGIVKRMVWQEIMTKKQCCSATDFARIAKTKTKTIILNEISQTDHRRSEVKTSTIIRNDQISQRYSKIT